MASFVLENCRYTIYKEEPAHFSLYARHNKLVNVLCSIKSYLICCTEQRHRNVGYSIPLKHFRSLKLGSIPLGQLKQ